MPTGNVACILLPALGGFAFFSMKSMIVASLVGTMVFSVIFLAISPMQVEMFELGHHFKVRPRDIGAGLLLGVAGGMIIYVFVHMLYVYGYGGENVATNWAMGGGGVGGTVEGIRASADQAYAAGAWPLAASAPLNIFHNTDATGIAIGVGITYVLALLRYLFVWFPIHPLGYVLGSTEYAQNVWFVCLVAWLIRSVVERIGGAHAIRRGLTPLPRACFYPASPRCSFSMRWDCICACTALLMSTAGGPDETTAASGQSLEHGAHFL